MLCWNSVYKFFKHISWKSLIRKHSCLEHKCLGSSSSIPLMVTIGSMSLGDKKRNILIICLTAYYYANNCLSIYVIDQSTSGQWLQCQDGWSKWLIFYGAMKVFATSTPIVHLKLSSLGINFICVVMLNNLHENKLLSNTRLCIHKYVTYNPLDCTKINLKKVSNFMLS